MNFFVFVFSFATPGASPTPAPMDIMDIIEREEEEFDTDTGVLLLTPATPAPQLYEREKVNNIIWIFDLFFGICAAIIAAILSNFIVVIGGIVRGLFGYKFTAALAAYSPSIVVLFEGLDGILIGVFATSGQKYLFVLGNMIEGEYLGEQYNCNNELVAV